MISDDELLADVFIIKFIDDDLCGYQQLGPVEVGSSMSFLRPSSDEEWFLVANFDPDELMDKIESISDLTTFFYESAFSADYAKISGAIPMIGVVSSFDEEVIDVRFRRLFAKIDITNGEGVVPEDALINAMRNDIELTVTEISIHNACGYVYYSDDMYDYIDSSNNSDGDYASSEDLVTFNNGGTVSLYVPAAFYDYLNNDWGGYDVDFFSLRQREINPDTLDEYGFYFHEYFPYVEIKGVENQTSTGFGAKTTTYDVVYRFFLGMESYSNFNILQNHSYHYVFHHNLRRNNRGSHWNYTYSVHNDLDDGSDKIDDGGGIIGPIRPGFGS